MANKALFKDLIFDEDGNRVETAVVGHEMFYVVDDAGFKRHIDAEQVDRQVLSVFLEQLEANKDIAVEQHDGLPHHHQLSRRSDRHCPTYYF